MRIDNYLKLFVWCGKFDKDKIEEAEIDPTSEFWDISREAMDAIDKIIARAKRQAVEYMIQKRGGAE